MMLEFFSLEKRLIAIDWAFMIIPIGGNGVVVYRLRNVEPDYALPNTSTLSAIPTTEICFKRNRSTPLAEWPWFTSAQL
jgi:hypothetical protein